MKTGCGFGQGGAGGSGTGWYEGSSSSLVFPLFTGSPAISILLTSFLQSLSFSVSCSFVASLF